MWWSFIARVRKYVYRKRLKNGIKEYSSYRINVPTRIAKELDNNTVLLILAREPEWYHLMDWNNKDNAEALWRRLPENIRAELCGLGIAPKELCDTEYIPIIMYIPKRELERLGLDPDKPLTPEQTYKEHKGTLIISINGGYPADTRLGRIRARRLDEA